MSEIGLFPLELVLLPSERVPLHIFEDRYRELVGECLADATEFGLILEDDDGLQAGRDAHRRDRARAHVRRRADERPGRGPGALPDRRGDRGPFVPDRRGGAARGRRGRGAERGGGRAHPRGRSGSWSTIAEADEVDVPGLGARTPLSFQLAARVDFGTVLKQELLELRSERARLDRLADLLAQAAGALAREREVRERASGNGKVTRD